MRSSPQAYNDEEWDGKWEDESVLLGGNAKEGVDRKAFTLLCAIAAPARALASAGVASARVCSRGPVRWHWRGAMRYALCAGR